MEVQCNRFVKTHGIYALFLLFFSIIFTQACCSSGPLLTIVPIEKPLDLYEIPHQQAQAHTSFYLDLKPYLSAIKPEIDYQVKKNVPRTYNKLNLIELPRGLTRVYTGNGVCSEVFSLNQNQSCILRFFVDKTNYAHSLRGGPVVCLVSNLSCSRPGPGQQLDDLVSRVPEPTQLSVIADDQNGLQYDPATMSIVGSPIKTGHYHLQLIATNGVAKTAQRDLAIEVTINPKDTPVFKPKHSIASAMPLQHYRLNLMDLIAPMPSFMVTNQVSFRIDSRESHPSWLSLDEHDGTLLQGDVPALEAGQEREITFIASSNAGGDSLPFTIKIPVAYDPTQKPVIDPGITLRGTAGSVINMDLRSIVLDSTTDSSLKIILDKIEPAAPWLSVDTTTLHGIVPDDVVGQPYQLTLHANTQIGGSSDPVVIPLEIAMNKDLTPGFYLDNPQLPLLYVGQPFLHDFVANQDVYPSNIPYVVDLAEGRMNPSWVRIEHNQLIIDSVPDGLHQIERVFVTIKNIPGGRSSVYPLDLFIMS